MYVGLTVGISMGKKINYFAFKMEFSRTIGMQYFWFSTHVESNESKKKKKNMKWNCCMKSITRDVFSRNTGKMYKIHSFEILPIYVCMCLYINNHKALATQHRYIYSSPCYIRELIAIYNICNSKCEQKNWQVFSISRYFVDIKLYYTK